MLMPKKVKYRKRQKGRIKGKATGGYTVSFGQYGLKAMAPGRMSLVRPFSIRSCTGKCDFSHIESKQHHVCRLGCDWQ